MAGSLHNHLVGQRGLIAVGCGLSDSVDAQMAWNIALYLPDLFMSTPSSFVHCKVSRIHGQDVTACCIMRFETCDAVEIERKWLAFSHSCLGTSVTTTHVGGSVICLGTQIAYGQSKSSEDIKYHSSKNVAGSTRNFI